LALGLAFAFSSSAFAQTYADQIQQLDAQITLVQKQKQLQDNLGADSILSKMPKVVSVMTFGTDTKAKLMLSSGVSLTYGEGEVINSRMRVVAITPREVVVAVTPTEGVSPKRGKKVADPVLMPLEFMVGANQNAMHGVVGGGMPGVPGTPVQGPIPPGLMQAPPPMQGGSPVALQAAPAAMPAAPPMAPAAPTN
jgi:hypothetical protein